MKYNVPNLNDTNAVLNYGTEAQTRIAEFSEITLKNLKTKDLGEVSGKIGELISYLDGIGENRPLRGFFRKPEQALKLRCQKACDAVDRISVSLQRQRDLLMRDIEMLELLYGMNREQYNRLSDYLNCGREALQEFWETTVLPLREARQTENTPQNLQAEREAMDRHDRFEKKLHDLELTRTVSLQMAPQIRLLQNNNAALAEKIQSSIVNTIPLWKSQMVLAIGMGNSEATVKMQEKVAEITNSLLLRNAKKLKDTTISITKEEERGSIEIETLRQTNAVLIETFDAMLNLREEGKKARKEAEEEMHRLQCELYRHMSQKASEKALPQSKKTT